MLENGDTLTVAEFLRRYEAMPELKNAQLIEGIVHMPSPVRADAHAKPDGLIQGWLFNYSLSRPELELYPNATLVLGAGHRKCGATRCHPLLGSRRWRARVAGPQRLPARRAGVRLRDCRQQCFCRPASETSSLSPQRRNCIGEYIVWLTLRWNRRCAGSILSKTILSSAISQHGASTKVASSLASCSTLMLS